MIFEKGQKVLVIGDSISDFDRARPVGEGLFNAWGTSYVADVGALLTSVYPELGLRIVNMGISGNTVRDLKARWDSDVVALNPDWVCVLIGINDVWRQFDSPNMTEQHVLLEEYVSTYEELIVRTMQFARGMVLMTPYYMEPNRNDPMRARMDEYGAAVKELAKKHGLICVDLQAAWDELFKYMHSCNIALDRIHPNQSGHMLIAHKLLDAVGFDWNHKPE